MVQLLLMAAATRPGSRWAYGIHSFKQGSRSFWYEMTQAAKVLPVVNPNKNEVRWEIPGGGVIYMLSLHPDAIEDNRGLHIDGLVLDEGQSLKDQYWRKIFYPMLTNKNGWCIITGTPNGLDDDNLLHRSYLRGQDPRLPAWSSIVYDVYNSGVWTPEEIEYHRLNSAQTPDEWDQEFECKFVGRSEGQIFKYFDPEVHIVTQNDLQVHVSDEGRVFPLGYEGYPVKLGLDFNLNPMTSVAALQTDDKTTVIYDELEIMNSNTDEMADEIQNRFGSANGRGRRIEIYPDQSGRRAQSSSAGRSDFSILKGHGFKVFERPGGNPSVVESIRLVNGLFAQEKPKVYVHERCKRLIQAWKTMTYKPNTSIPDKSNELNHLFDAARYLLHFTSPYAGSSKPVISRVKL